MNNIHGLIKVSVHSMPSSASSVRHRRFDIVVQTQTVHDRLSFVKDLDINLIKTQIYVKKKLLLRTQIVLLRLNTMIQRIGITGIGELPVKNSHVVFAVGKKKGDKAESNIANHYHDSIVMF